MSHTLLALALQGAQLLLLAAMACALWRMVGGPRAQDRILTLDAFYIDAMILLVTIGIRTGSQMYAEASLIIGLLGFVGTMAFAKFLMRGQVIE